MAQTIKTTFERHKNFWLSKMCFTKIRISGDPQKKNPKMALDTKYTKCINSMNGGKEW